MSLVLTKELLNRLICAKILFINGIDITNKGAPFNSGFAVLCFQDSVEMVLRVIAEHHNVQLKSNVAFNQLIDLINNKGVGIVTHTTQLYRLNNARVSFKHVGLEPKKEDVIKFRNDLESFFPVVINTFLGVDYNLLSLVKLIGYRRVENFLSKAEKYLEQDLYEDSLEMASIAFTLYRRNHEKHNDAYSHPESNSLSFVSSSNSDLENWAIDADETLQYHQLAIELVSNGISLNEYNRFKRYTPDISFLLAGNYFVNKNRYDIKKQCNYDNALFCCKFAVESILQLKNNRLPMQYSFDLSYSRFKITKDTDIIVYPVDKPEKIRTAKAGEIIKGYSGRVKKEKNGYVEILQDGDNAYIKTNDMIQIENI